MGASSATGSAQRPTDDDSDLQAAIAASLQVAEANACGEASAPPAASSPASALLRRRMEAAAPPPSFDAVLSTPIAPPPSDVPPPPSFEEATRSGGLAPSPEGLASLEAMGFSHSVAAVALARRAGNVQAAADDLLEG